MLWYYMNKAVIEKKGTILQGYSHIIKNKDLHFFGENSCSLEFHLCAILSSE